MHFRRNILKIGLAYFVHIDSYAVLCFTAEKKWCMKRKECFDDTILFDLPDSQEIPVCRTLAWTEGCVWAIRDQSSSVSVRRPGQDPPATKVMSCLHDQNKFADYKEHDWYLQVWESSSYIVFFFLHLLCSDMDECKQNPCPTGSKCLNSNGSFHCECPLGYHLEDGRTCTRGDPEMQISPVYGFVKVIPTCSLQAFLSSFYSKDISGNFQF